MLFLSYSRGNLIIVRSVAAELRRLGYRTWLDLESLRPGERWRDAIDRALAASDAMVFCVSRLSIDSAWTSVELRAALDRGLPVVPLMIDAIDIDALPPHLRALHVVGFAGVAAHDMPRQAALAIARSVGRPSQREPWRDDEAADALQVRLDAAPALSWLSRHWQSPPAPLTADALAELARAADEARAAELHLAPGTPPLLAALVLGTLASRLGASRIRIHAGAELLAQLDGAASAVRALSRPQGDGSPPDAPTAAACESTLR